MNAPAWPGPGPPSRLRLAAMLPDPPQPALGEPAGLGLLMLEWGLTFAQVLDGAAVPPCTRARLAADIELAIGALVRVAPPPPPASVAATCAALAPNA